VYVILNEKVIPRREDLKNYNYNAIHWIKTKFISITLQFKLGCTRSMKIVMYLTLYKEVSINVLMLLGKKLNNGKWSFLLNKFKSLVDLYIRTLKQR